jgi:hypothetical protein
MTAFLPQPRPAVELDVDGDPLGPVSLLALTEGEEETDWWLALRPDGRTAWIRRQDVRLERTALDVFPGAPS